MLETLMCTVQNERERDRLQCWARTVETSRTLLVVLTSHLKTSDVVRPSRASANYASLLHETSNDSTLRNINSRIASKHKISHC